MESGKGRVRTGLVLLLVALAGLGSAAAAPGAMSVARTELGGIALEQGVRMQQEQPTEPNPYLDRALRNYQAAVSWDAGNAHAWRKLGEVYLTLGQNDPAREALSRAVALRPEQPLYWALLGDAYDGLGASVEALDAWTTGRAGVIRRDQVLVNGAKIADAHVQAGDPLSGVPVLKDVVLKLDPNDLYALAIVVTAYDSAVEGDHPLADPYREAARYPSKASLEPGADPRLAEYQARGAVELYRAGYWDSVTVANVLHYWAAEANPAAIRAAELLRQAEPERGEWLLAYAEALIYAGRPAEALSVLEGAADAPSVRRWRALAAVTQARADDDPASWRRAQAELLAYGAAAPQDLWPLAVLAEASQRVGDLEDAAQWSKALAERTEGADRAAVAEALLVADDDFELSRNLVPEGDFESWSEGLPSGWVWSDMATGEPWNLGLYVGGPERVQALAGTSMRLLGVWRQTDPEKEICRAGYWLYDASAGGLRPVQLTPGSHYLVSLDYLVQPGGDPYATVWLSYNESPCWSGDRGLEPTQGEWRHATWVCGAAAPDDDPLQPLLRLFGSGAALYDNLQIREVILAPGRGEG